MVKRTHFETSPGTTSKRQRLSDPSDTLIIPAIGRISTALVHRSDRIVRRSRSKRHVRRMLSQEYTLNNDARTNAKSLTNPANEVAETQLSSLNTSGADTSKAVPDGIEQLSAGTHQINLAISNRHGIPVMYAAEDFSDDEAAQYMEEMEDALEAMNRFERQRSEHDNGYCSEDET